MVNNRKTILSFGLLCHHSIVSSAFITSTSPSSLSSTFAFAPRNVNINSPNRVGIHSNRVQSRLVHDNLLVLSASNKENNNDILLNNHDALLRSFKTATTKLVTLLTIGGTILFPSIDTTNTVSPTNFLRPQPVHAAIDTTTTNEELKPGSRQTVIDEVWTLINKYYIDQTFNNQDWNQVRNDYVKRLTITPEFTYDDEEAMKLTTSMVQSLGDKYSRVLDKPSYARIQKFDLIGVGMTLMPDPDTKKIMVGAPPVEGSSADKAGIKYGDFITAVNGCPTQGRTAFDIIDQVAENPNAPSIVMTVESVINNNKDDNVSSSSSSSSNGGDEEQGNVYKRDVTLSRQFQEVKNPVSFKITERRSDGTIVGYIRVSEFNSLVKAKLQEAIIQLENEGANAFVLDLRGNPGGAFQSAVEIAGLFLDDKVATSVIDSNQVVLPFRTTRGKVIMPNEYPLAIWVDGGSASATEVLAGALHDQCRAVVMGSHSFGKGLIQAVYGLKNGSGLVLTVAKYTTPNGDNIQGIGINPDIEVSLPFLYLPGVGSDTSKVDFTNISSRLQPSMCTPPSNN